MTTTDGLTTFAGYLLLQGDHVFLADENLALAWRVVSFWRLPTAFWTIAEIC